MLDENARFGSEPTRTFAPRWTMQERRLMRWSWILLLFAWLLSGCGLVGGLRADPVAVSAQKPSNVAVYVAVYHGDRAARGLTEKSFRIYEDGQALDPGQTQQVLLPREIAAVHHALLLIDMSGEISDDEKARLAVAAGRFATRVRKGQPVTVYGFDGAPRIRQLATFPKGEQEVETVAGVASYRATDPSSNLHSAVVEALKQLDTRLMSRQLPIRIGTLVVLARTSDLAGRVTEQDMTTAIDESSHHVLAVTLDSASVPSIGKNGTFTASSPSSFGTALDDAARATEELLERYYVLSYCSPARAGTRALTVEVTAIDDEGKEIGGSFDAEFDAAGFSTGCNPKATPRFVIPAEPIEEEEEVDRGGSRSRRGSGGAPPPAVESEEIVPPPDKPGYAQ
jgi:hypothetical protein